MKGNGKLKDSGQYSEFTIRSRDISLIYSTSVMQSAEVDILIYFLNILLLHSNIGCIIVIWYRLVCLQCRNNLFPEMT